MINTGYRETRVIRNRSKNPRIIKITCRVNFISELLKVAREAEFNETHLYVFVIVNNKIYHIDGREQDGYIISEVMNL